MHSLTTDHDKRPVAGAVRCPGGLGHLFVIVKALPDFTHKIYSSDFHLGTAALEFALHNDGRVRVMHSQVWCRISRLCGNEGKLSVSSPPHELLQAIHRFLNRPRSPAPCEALVVFRYLLRLSQEPATSRKASRFAAPELALHTYRNADLPR